MHLCYEVGKGCPWTRLALNKLEKWRLNFIEYCDLLNDFPDMRIEMLLFSSNFSPTHGIAFISRDSWPLLTDPMDLHFSFVELRRDVRGCHTVKHWGYSNFLFLKLWVYKMIQHFVFTNPLCLKCIFKEYS